MAKKSEKCNWIVGTCSSEWDGVALERVYGTEFQVKRYLVELVAEARANNEDSWDYGTEKIKDVEVEADGTLNASGVYSDFHIDYSAIREPEPTIL